MYNIIIYTVYFKISLMKQQLLDSFNEISLICNIVYFIEIIDNYSLLFSDIILFKTIGEKYIYAIYTIKLKNMIFG